MYAGAINNPESLSMEVGAANTEADVPATGPASARVIGLLKYFLKIYNYFPR